MPESYSERGFAQYSGKVSTEYGHDVSVYESSAAMEHCVWLRVEGREDCAVKDARGQDVTAHLSEDQALRVYNALGEFLGLPAATLPGDEPDPPARKAYRRLSLQQALDFTLGRQAVKANDLMVAYDVSESTAYRALASLETRGHVARDPSTGAFSVRPGAPEEVADA